MRAGSNRAAHAAAVEAGAPMRRAVQATLEAGGSPERLRKLRAEILAVYAELSAALLAQNRRRK
jgi:hypothetical protein